MENMTLQNQTTNEFDLLDGVMTMPIIEIVLCCIAAAVSYPVIYGLFLLIGGK